MELISRHLIKRKMNLHNFPGESPARSENTRRTPRGVHYMSVQVSSKVTISASPPSSRGIPRIRCGKELVMGKNETLGGHKERHQTVAGAGDLRRFQSVHIRLRSIAATALSTALIATTLR